MSDTVIDILESLETTAGSNAKRDILKRNCDNELLRRVFAAAQDPYMVYYVNKFKMPQAQASAPVGDDKTLTAFLDVLLPDLSSRKLTGNEAKFTVSAAFQLMDARQQKWCLRILLKNLRCGVQESTVNKIWPGTIKSFAVALASSVKSTFVKGEGIKILEKIAYPVRVEPKLDGLRCIAVKKDGRVTFFTRNGTELETLPRIKAALEAAEYDNVVLDGEAMGEDWNESSSVLMSSKNKKDDSNIFYNVFDAMAVDDWIDQETTVIYSDRCELVATVVEMVNTGCVRQVPHIMAKDEAELKAFFAKCMNEGYEGVMLKTLDSTYEWDRSRNILKLKPVTTFEGVVVGWYEGRRGTKREGLFGGFNVVLPNGVVTRVGGGFSDKLRAEIMLEMADSWLGKIVEVEGQPDPLTKDGLTVDGKVRFPVYIRVRSPGDVDPKVIAAGEAYLAKEMAQ
jgi:DNA ligase-1